MLKNILSVKGARTLSKSDQKQVMGGNPPLLNQCCGGTGGKVVSFFHCLAPGGGHDICNNACYACY